MVVDSAGGFDGIGQDSVESIGQQEGGRAVKLVAQLAAGAGRTGQYGAI